jgi:hypothetical protein
VIALRGMHRRVDLGRLPRPICASSNHRMD